MTDTITNNGEADIEVPTFISDGVMEVQRLMKFSRMTDLGFTLGSRLSELVDILGSRLKNVREAEKVLDWLRDMAKELQPYAEQETSNDMAYLRALVAIRFVTILETVVQDAVVASLEHVPAVLNRQEIRRIKGPIVELLSAPPPDVAEFLAAALAQEVKVPLQTGVARFEALLEAVGLAGGVDDSARRVLFELLHVRNVLVHKNGRADARFIKSCSWLQLKPGNELRVSAGMTERYKNAVVYYLCEIFMRWARRDGVTTGIGPMEQVRENALVMLREGAG